MLTQLVERTSKSQLAILWCEKLSSYSIIAYGCFPRRSGISAGRRLAAIKLWLNLGRSALLYVAVIAREILRDGPDALLSSRNISSTACLPAATRIYYSVPRRSPTGKVNRAPATSWCRRSKISCVPCRDNYGARGFPTLKSIDLKVFSSFVLHIGG